MNNSFMSLGRIVGPLSAGYLFDINLNYPYLGGAIIMLMGFFVSLIWVRPENSLTSDVARETMAQTIEV